MTFRDTFFNVKQLMVNRLIDFGLEDADIDLGWTTLLTLAQNTRITINVPLNLTYSDDFSITGTLETATYRRLSNKTLKLKVGNTVVATTETDINGAYSFTTSPVSMGNHSFQVIFEGTNIHNPSQSSVVNRTIGKETSVINLDIIPTAHINGSTAVAGTLKSDDAELIKNATMKLDTTSGNTLTTTTNDYGQFSFTLTDIPDFNNVSVTCYFEGDEYYSPSTITTPVAVYQETLELTSDKNILSYADDDYATLTVQYKDTGDMNLGAGKEIDLYRVYEVSGIQLTSDKDILSYADNDTCTITAQLINGILAPENVKVSDVPVTFKAPSGVYDDKESIPTQTSAFSMLFKKESGDNIIIHSPSESDEDYLFLDIRDISTDSELRLDWDTNNVNFYIDGVLSNTRRIYQQYSGEDTTVWNYSDLAISGYGVISDIQIDNFHTINTDNTGKATFTYYSKGIGDIDITASISDTDGTKLTKTFVIVDAKFYDASSSANISKYSKTGNGSLSYDSTNQCYLLNNGSTNWKWTSWIMSNVDFSNTVTVKAKIRLLTNYNCQVSLGLYGSKGLVGNSILASSATFYAVQVAEQELQSDATSKGQETLTSSDIQTNVWYDVEITYSSGSATFKLYNGSTLVKTVTGSSSVLTSNTNKLMFNIGMYGNSQANIKDITVL